MPSADRQTLLIVGLGLIGGSIARSLADRPGYRVLACGRDDRPLRQAQSDGVIDDWSQDVSELAPQADIVLVATPTRTVDRIFDALAGCVGRDTIITDAASVKGSVITEAQRFFPDSMDRIVPAHPIAGSEKTGYAASFADLYRGRNVIITPDHQTRADALKKVVQLWQYQGAEVHLMSAERHDEILAGTSHLPHLLAFDLVNTLTESVSEPDRPWQVFDFAAGGFADFSRIASSDATMWRDIFLTNSQATVSLLDRYIEHLQRTRDSILAQDGDTLHQAFTQAKTVRDDFIASFNARRDRAASQSLVTAPEGSHVIEDEPVEEPVERVSRQLTWQSSASLLSGEITLSASNECTRQAIEKAKAKGGVTVIHGCPDNRAIRDFIQCQIADGALISGPEKGRVTVYSETAGGFSEASLSANSAVLAAIALLVAARPGKIEAVDSAVVVKSSLDMNETIPAVLTWLQSCGLLAIQRQGNDLSFGLSPDQPEGRDSLTEMTHFIQSDDEWLLVMIALVWHRCLPEQWQVKIEGNRGRALLRRLSPLNQIGFRVQQEGVDASGDIILSLGRVDDTAQPIALDAANDAWLALCVLVVTSSTVQSGKINNAGNIRETFPGLIDQINRLGLNVKETSQ